MQVSMATRDELVEAVAQRYAGSGRNEKTRILDEFVAVTGFHRKHAMRLLRNGQQARRSAKPKVKRRRGRRRPDPLAQVREQLHAWFDEEPWRTGRELLERLQAEHPDLYPDHLLRTLQRRLKDWRRAKAHAMVFGTTHADYLENVPQPEVSS